MANENISKEDLKKEIQEILKDADLDNTSAKKVFFHFVYPSEILNICICICIVYSVSVYILYVSR